MALLLRHLQRCNRCIQGISPWTNRWRMFYLCSACHLILDMNVKPGTAIWYILLRIRKAKFLLVVLVFAQPSLDGQSIEIDALNDPLNEVLMEMARDHGIQLSFDDQLLSGYRVTLRQSFQKPDEAIARLVKDLPLAYRKIGEVFTIYPSEPETRPENYLLTGRVIDSHTGEVLPFSHILVNQTGVISDFNGNFSYVSGDSLFQLRISYLGYYIKDTTLAAGTGYTVALTPSLIGLREVVIKGSLVERSGQQGDEAGTIRLNHQIAYRLPGNGDNAVFNFLRLQPGILAAGERASELIIWGSYSGHSKIMFDGFTIYGLKNFNDNIYFVNPYLAKDIKVLKGGFPSDYDNRVGGIVDISGLNGSTQKPSINLNINNMTANGMVSVPIAKRSAVTFAYRQTYYNLYDAEDLNIISGTRGRGNSGQTDVNVFPDYGFRDVNLKYAGTLESGDSYFISLYQGRDKFSFSVDQERNKAQIDHQTEEANRQQGATAFLGHTWKNGWNSHFSFSASGLERDAYEKQLVTRLNGNSIISDKEVAYYNRILDLSLKNKNRIPLTEKQILEVGWNYTHESTRLGEGPAGDSLVLSRKDSHRVGFFIQDEIHLTPRFTLKPGIRADYSFFLEKAYIQPRIQASLDLTDQWRVNAAAGLYNQFVSETSVIDELGNFRYFWALNDNVALPVLKAAHLVGGLHYHVPGLSMGLEGFYKTTEGISRYRWIDGSLEVAQGNARSYGMDVMLKKYIKKHEAWASYTLSKTEEHFNSMPFDAYMDAPQDQRHEVKGALLLNFKPFFFSANYVYGSGFRPPSSILSNLENRYPYNRLDVSVIYRHSIREYHIEAGLSILNVLNHENIKYANVLLIPDSQNSTIRIHAEAVPFTPTLYLNVSF